MKSDVCRQAVSRNLRRNERGGLTPHAARGSATTARRYGRRHSEYSYAHDDHRALPKADSQAS